MKKLIAALFILFTSASGAQDKIMKVWPEGAPVHNGMNQPEEIYEGGRVRNVSEAEMYIYLALKENNIPAEIHIFREGGHGFGMRKNNLPVMARTFL